MKNLCAMGLLAVCIIATQSLSAQQPVTTSPALNKPQLLTQLPQKLECNLPAVQKLSAFRLADKISLQFGDVPFAGEVVDKVQRSAGVLTMNIRSTNFPGSLFTISIIKEADNTQ